MEATEEYDEETRSCDGEMDADIIIIGAGISGLVAAYTIKKKDAGLRVLVLEAKDRVGGRTLTVEMPTGKTGETDQFDLGGQWVGHSQRHIMNLVWEMGLTTYPQFTKGKKVMRLGSDQLRTYTGDIPSLGSWMALLDLQRFITKAEDMCQAVSMMNLYEAPNAAELDGMTAQTFIHQNLWTCSAREAVETAIQATLGADPSQVSALYLLASANAAGGVMKLFLTSKGSAQELKIRGGAQQICFRLAESIGSDCLRLKEPVTKVEQDYHGVLITTRTGKCFRSAQAIVAIPPNMVLQIQFSPALPEPRRRILERHLMGHLNKFVVTYERSFWRKKGFSGEVVSNGGPSPFASCLRGPLSITYDATSFDGTPAILGFLSATNGVQWGQRTLEERKQAILRSLSTCFESEDAMNPVGYAEHLWGEEPYCGGCPVAFGVPGSGLWLPLMRQPLEHIYWAGTETASEWPGYMSGAVQAGQRAALELLYQLRPQSLALHELHQLPHLLASRKRQAPHSPPYGVFRWTIALPLAALVSLWLAYCFRRRYWFLGTGYIC